MDAAGTVVRFAHETNSWLVLVSGSLAVAALLVEAVHRKRSRQASLVVGLFSCFVYLQAVLGGTTASLLRAGDTELFDGNADKTLWHIILGVVAAVSVTVAFLARRRETGHVVPLVAAAIALIAPNVGRLIPLIFLTAIFYGLVELVRRGRQQANEPSTKSNL